MNKRLIRIIMIIIIMMMMMVTIATIIIIIINIDISCTLCMQARAEWRTLQQS